MPLGENIFLTFCRLLIAPYHYCGGKDWAVPVIWVTHCLLGRPWETQWPGHGHMYLDQFLYLHPPDLIIILC